MNKYSQYEIINSRNCETNPRIYGLKDRLHKARDHANIETATCSDPENWPKQSKENKRMRVNGCPVCINQ